MLAFVGTVLYGAVLALAIVTALMSPFTDWQAPVALVTSLALGYAGVVVNRRWPPSTNAKSAAWVVFVMIAFPGGLMGIIGHLYPGIQSGR
jgi:hypothetical protein